MSRSLLPVNHHEKLSSDGLGLYHKVLHETAEILDRNQVKFFSINFVRFCREEPDKEDPSKTVDVISPPTFWILVKRENLKEDVASVARQELLSNLKGHDIDDVDVQIEEGSSWP